MKDIGKSRYRKLNDKLIEKLNREDFLIVSHRGVWGGNIAQNTDKASILASSSGADIVEVDIGKSKDGEFLAFHTTEEKTILGIDSKLEELTYSQILEHPILNHLGEKSSSTVQTIKHYIENSDKDVIFQVDRSWPYFPEILDYFYHTFDDSVLKRVMFKCYVNDVELSYINNFKYKFMLMPIIKKKSEIEILEKYDDINIVGIEVIAEDKKADSYGKEFIDLLKAKFNVAIQLNAIKISNDVDLYAGFDDDMSLVYPFGAGWSKLLDLGADIIQTDWTLNLDQYRKNEQNKI